MSEPTTEAGQTLLRNMLAMRERISSGPLAQSVQEFSEDILAIENEARASQPLTLDVAARQVEQSRYAIRHGSVGGPCERVSSAALDALRAARESKP